MKRFKSPILSAEKEVDPLDDLIDAMGDDFSYFLAGIQKMQRDNNADTAYNVAMQLNDAIQLAIVDISEYFQPEE